MNTDNIIEYFEQNQKPDSDIIIVEKEIKNRKEEINYYMLNKKDEVIDFYPDSANIKIDIIDIKDLREYKFIEYKNNETKYEYDIYKKDKHTGKFKIERPFIKRIGRITYRDFMKKIHYKK